MLSVLLYWSVSRSNVTSAFADLSFAAIIGDHSFVPIVCTGLQAAQEKARISLISYRFLFEIIFMHINTLCDRDSSSLSNDDMIPPSLQV